MSSVPYSLHLALQCFGDKVRELCYLKKVTNKRMGIKVKTEIGFVLGKQANPNKIIPKKKWIRIVQ